MQLQDGRIHRAMDREVKIRVDTLAEYDRLSLQFHLDQAAPVAIAVRELKVR